MEKLHFPEGCIIEGEIRAVQNEGDVIVEGDFAPLSLVSNHGDVHYKPSSPKVAFEVMRAPNGTLLVEAKDLSGKALEGQSINISADNLNVEGHLRASGELKLSGGSLEITHVGGETIHIRADNLVIEKLTCDGEIHLDAEMAKIVEARARKLVIRGAFNSQKVVAEEAVVAESGKIAIKMLDAPHFEAASDVRGIVMISTCASVKAEGVRGFLHADEVSMLNEEASTLDLTNYIDRREAFRQETVSEGPTDADEDGTVKMNTADVARVADESAAADPAEEEMEAAPSVEEPVLGSEAEPSLSDDEPLSSNDPVEDESLEESSPVLAVEDAEVFDDGSTDRLTRPGLVDAADVSFDAGEADATFEEETPTNTNDAIETFDLDVGQEVESASVEENSYDGWETPANQAQSDETEAENLQDGFNAYRTDTKPEQTSSWEDDAADGWEMAEEPSTETGWEEVSTPLAETSAGSNFEEYSDAALGEEDAEELTSEDLDEVAPETDVDVDDSLPEVTEFDPGISGTMEALGSEDLLEIDDAEAPVDPEQHLVDNLNLKLEEVKAYFAEDDYPRFIGQLQRYIEDRRFNLFAKQRNREAVLASFDKFNRDDISRLAREFFQLLDDYFSQYGE